MILVEVEPTLPVAVESVRAQVLVCLQAMHKLREFSTRVELAGFLDDVLDEVVAMDAPRGLSRVLLFYRNPAVVAEVEQRLLPGATFLAFRSPACWAELGAKLPELRRWAQRFEPNFPTMPVGI